MDNYEGRFLKIVEEMVFGEEELTTLFNTALREPLQHAEIRSLRPLVFPHPPPMFVIFIVGPQSSYFVFLSATYTVRYVFFSLGTVPVCIVFSVCPFVNTWGVH